MGREKEINEARYAAQQALSYLRAAQQDFWTEQGITRAVWLVLTESSTLFDSLTDKVTRFPDLRNILFEILMNGTEF